jgi:selenocysteine lyase/cysteine desulfurase
VALLLGERYGVGVRDGLFCAHPLTRRLLARAGRAGSAVRASIGIGVEPDDIDRLLAAVTEIARGAR